MGDVNKVAVKIYGQEYIISGEMSREHIIRVADYVDGKMHEIAAVLPSGSTSSLAVLSAVNAADDYFSAAEMIGQLRGKNAQLEKDSQHYVELWEEAKRNFLQYKEDAQAGVEQKERLQKAVNDKIVELTNLSNAYTELEKRYSALRAQHDEAARKLSQQESSRSESFAMVKELEAKCKDVESSFFDLQMENIQLKGELDRMKKAAEGIR